MTPAQPETELDTRYSGDGATATPWSTATAILEAAEIFWISTVHPEGRPHVTPLIAVWWDEALFFCTGADERKGRNLARNRSCALTTGCNVISEGLDIVVEGEAASVRDPDRLQSVADAYVAKYGEGWRFGVRDGAFVQPHGTSIALVYEVRPVKAFGFGKGEFSQTRWRFPR